MATGDVTTQGVGALIQYKYEILCGDQTVVRLSYLHNGISYADKMVS